MRLTALLLAVVIVASLVVLATPNTSYAKGADRGHGGKECPGHDRDKQRDKARPAPSVTTGNAGTLAWYLVELPSRKIVEEESSFSEHRTCLEAADRWNQRTGKRFDCDRRP